MCGIAGLLTRDGANPGSAVFESLDRALAHRGPDGSKIQIGDGVGLLHRRLAIIDLETGDQPLSGPGGLTLIANGEIYNHIELRAELADSPFATKSDCEPPLYLYQRDGMDFARSLRGMYAIALHDGPRKRLVLARDRFGIKPLYWAETPRGFAFASEPQAIIAAGLMRPNLRGQARGELLNLQFTLGGETIFEGIHRLLPGESIAIEQGQIGERRRLPALPAGDIAPWTEDEAIRELDRVLAESVSLHQRSDVPYGMFLSGGIDSSALLALMARLNSRPVLAYTAFFPGTGATDESEHAKDVAAAAGAEHVQVPVAEADFWALLPEIAASMDDPAADYAIVPSYILARAARASVKVILSGEGGDEMFGGYGRYRKAMRPWPFGGRMRESGTFHGLGVLRDESQSWRTLYRQTRDSAYSAHRTRLQDAQAQDCADWLPNDLLIKLDRCLMANGIEGRTPFLDTEVAGFAFALPDRLKVGGGLGKILLRRWLAQTMPAAKPFSKKRGFTVPVAEWLAARPDLGRLLAGRPAIREICRDGAVEALFKTPGGKAGFAAWTLLFYALWHRRHIEGLAPVGDVFETLNTI
jgi:asparagine synthase (glutamine-hydrolysing)